MPAARQSYLHRLVTIGTAAIFVMLAVLAGGSPASAHDALVSSDPAADSTVETMPQEISLSFSAALLTMSPKDTVVNVVSAAGEDVTDGDAVVDGAIVRQALREPTEAGTYTVTWHVVSSDGHPTEGTFAFTVASVSGGGAVAPENDETTTPPPPKTVVTPTPTPVTDSPTATPSAAPGEAGDRSFGEMLPWILLGVTGIAIAGALIAVLVSRSRGGAGRDDEDEVAPDQD
jgi:methionine-rich copper-binding protein CopC